MTLLTPPDNAKRSEGQADGQPAHEFYHVRVRHTDPLFPFASRRPAWSARATIEVFERGKTEPFINEVIECRWPSRPEPIKDVVVKNRLVTILDRGLLFVGRYSDVHYHESRRDRVMIDTAVKFEGEEDCYIFSNESYGANGWRKPEWRLPFGVYRLRYTVYYETGEAVADFRLDNGGTRRDDVHITLT